MKPINTKHKGCVATSSNCVIWQGPDLPGINLCHGDVVSDVIFALATKICSLHTQVDLDSYDISLLDVSDCDVKNFVGMIQYLIEQISILQSNTNSNSGTSSAPTEFAVATCFQGEGAVQDLNTYVANIGVKVCNLSAAIDIQNSAITQLNATIASLQSQINILTTP